MALAKKCDRCGKLYEYYEKIEHEKYVGYNAMTFVCVTIKGGTGMATCPIGLCPECMGKLINFLEEKEK
jgi:phage FluMu protein Com|nr:MAG TPA: hypothetical protein [Caudoviricetes sp.]